MLFDEHIETLTYLPMKSNIAKRKQLDVLRTLAFGTEYDISKHSICIITKIKSI